MSGADAGSLIPARPSDRFKYWFARYVRKLLRRRFHAVRVANEGIETLRELDERTRPAIVLLNHSSWWDPLVAFFADSHFAPNRSALAPIDNEQLERFGFFRRIGLFGINPDDPASLKEMRSYVLENFQASPKTILWLTPQGRFTDVRAPIRIRPGAANIAAGVEGVDVVSLAIEYVFWQESRAEILMRATPVEPPKNLSTAGWQRAMTAKMQENSDALAALSQNRDASEFTAIVGDRARTSFFYDLMLRLRGKGGEIAARRESDKETVRA